MRSSETIPVLAFRWNSFWTIAATILFTAPDDAIAFPIATAVTRTAMQQSIKSVKMSALSSWMDSSTALAAGDERFPAMDLSASMVDLSNLSKDLLSDLPTKLPSPPSIDWSAADLFIPLVPPSVLSTTDWKAFVPQSMPPVDSPEFPVIVAGVSLAMGILALSVARGPDDQSTTTTDTDGVAGKRRAKPAKSAFNVEIPYDAATRLAYDEWRREHNSAPYSEEGYSVFRKMYTAQAIADATTKKLTRDMESLFDNRAQPPVPPRQVSQNSASSTSRTNSDQANLPFFASIE